MTIKRYGVEGGSGTGGQHLPFARAVEAAPRRIDSTAEAICLVAAACSFEALRTCFAALLVLCAALMISLAARPCSLTALLTSFAVLRISVAALTICCEACACSITALETCFVCVAVVSIAVTTC